jgi:hypothetical protein
VCVEMALLSGGGEQVVGSCAVVSQLLPSQQLARGP